MAGTLSDKFQDLSDAASKLAQELAATGTDVATLEAVQHHGQSFVMLLTVFALACFVGYYVVWKVTPALHSPLMGVTNAISSVIIVGAILAATPQDGSTLSRLLGLMAVFLASINIFGGFAVTRRMLEMFRKKEPVTGVSQ
jgi:H+-translocating NAD(P) transhydrogenase subunit alpha